MKRMDKISRLRDSVSEKVFKVLFLEKQLPVDDVSKRGIRAPSAAASGRFAQVDPHLKFREFRFAIAFENRLPPDELEQPPWREALDAIILNLGIILGVVGVGMVLTLLSTMP